MKQKKLTRQSWCILFKVVVKTGSVLRSLHVREPIGDNEDFQGAFMNVQKGQKQPKGRFSKETAVWTHFFQGYGRDSSCSGLITCQGTLRNQSETTRTFQDPSGTSKRAQNSQVVDFQRRQQSRCIFSRLWERLKLFWTFAHVRVPYGTIKRHWRYQRRCQDCH